MPVLHQREGLYRKARNSIPKEFHAFPRSTRHGLRWWELDLTYLTIRILAFLRIVRNVSVPA